MNTYKVKMYVNGTEDDAISLRKSLAQSVYDEYELGSVFGVSVELDVPPENLFDRVMALYMVELEDGLDYRQICRLMDELPANRKYVPIEYHGEQSAAYGYVDTEYFEIHDYKPDFCEDMITSILDDMVLENPDGRYMTPDGRQFFMSYCPV